QTVPVIASDTTTQWQRQAQAEPVQKMYGSPPANELPASVMLRATVVGINEYRDEKYRHKARLRFASSDATQVANLLKSSTVFSAEKVTLLTNEEATRKKVRECLSETFTRRSFDSNT